MIQFFQPKGTRTRKQDDPYSLITVDAVPEGKGKTGFALNRTAVRELRLELTGKEYGVFAQSDGNLFFTVADEATVKASKCINYRIGKSGKGNNRTAWEFVTGFVAAGETYRLVAHGEGVYEITPIGAQVEAPVNEVEAEVEVEEVYEPHLEVVEDTTPDFDGF